MVSLMASAIPRALLLRISTIRVSHGGWDVQGLVLWTGLLEGGAGARQRLGTWSAGCLNGSSGAGVGGLVSEHAAWVSCLRCSSAAAGVQAVLWNSLQLYILALCPLFWWCRWIVSKYHFRALKLPWGSLVRVKGVGSSLDCKRLPASGCDSSAVGELGFPVPAW